ncbi:uncharacterized protein LOC117288334 [Asterias rubens]|uniref:uncharacterized protein LOC117288334 n=1 Tax=Asterias rubens TaxID=7604 RepID=UPI0014558D9C|nr:uncharacterized protein LOC117288334 [Asterias rubens]
MPLTNKEKMARKRAHLQENLQAYPDHLEKDRKRKKAERAFAKSQMSEPELVLHRASENARIQAFRYSKRAGGNGAINAEVDATKPSTSKQLPYRSPQSLGKAVKRARASLPSSPRKRKVVATAIAKEVVVNVIMNKPHVAKNYGLDEDTKKKVIEFYLKDDISWQAPGRKDRVIIRSTDKHGNKMKTTLQARYMLMALSEAHKLLCRENDISVGLSKFCDLRPKHVKLFDSIPHNVCVCTYHENVRLLLISLKGDTCTGLPESTSVFTDTIVCDTNSKECMTQDCPECKGKIHDFAPELTDESIVKYSQWQKNDGNTEKVEITSTVHMAFEELLNQLKVFLVHVYVKRKQSAYREMLLKNVDGEEIVLQVDFSENASLAHQNETQSAHWNHGQATLFTAHAWIKSNPDTTCTRESYVLVSDELLHGKLSVHAFMTHIFSDLKQKYQSIQKISVFSDGASSQFKQRFLFSNLHMWEEQFDVELRWHFFATSHGKGVVDGLGGTVQRSVWRYVRSGKAEAVTPMSFFQVAAERNPNVCIHFIPKTGIEQSKTMLETHWEKTVSVPNTQKIHSVKTKGKHFLVVSDTSESTKYSEVRILEEEEADLNDSLTSQAELLQETAGTEMTLHIGDWVAVRYDGDIFPGEVTDFGHTLIADIKVNVMHKSGSHCKWPQDEDHIFYARKDVLEKLKPPIVAGNRGQFTFDLP